MAKLGESALNHPTLGKQNEALSVIRAFNHFQIPTVALLDLRDKVLAAKGLSTQMSCRQDQNEAQKNANRVSPAWSERPAL